MKLLKKYPHLSPEELTMARWENEWHLCSQAEKAEAAEFYREAFYAVFSGDLPVFAMDVEQARQFEILQLPDVPKA